MINLAGLTRGLRLTLLLMVAGFAWLAMVGPPNSATGSAVSTWSALSKDAGTGAELVARQLAQPPTSASAIPVLITCALFAFLLVVPGRRFLLRRNRERYARRHAGTELSDFGPAVFAIVVTPVLFALGWLMLALGVNAAVRLLPATAALATLSMIAVVVTGVGVGIGHALRNLDNSTQRPIALPPGLRRTIWVYPAAAGAMLGLSALTDQTSRLLGAAQVSWSIAQGLVVLAEAALIARFLLHIGRAREHVAADGASGGVPAVFGVAILAWGALAVGCGALVLGRVRFAMMVMQEILWVAIVLTAAWLVTRFAGSLVSRLLDTQRHTARFATSVVGVGQARVSQISLLLSAALSLVIWMVAALLVLAPVLGDGGNVVQQMRPSPLAASLSSINLSPRIVLTAAAVLIGGVMLTRLIRNWLERKFLPTTHLDVGIRTSLVTGVSYVGVVAALLVTTSTLGVQLERITLIASALSVGIGFGLQAIIQNFVSGVILLAERPVKIGDRVTVSGSEGRVARIRVRATELIADDGEIAIVPNSAFISSTVVNKGTAIANPAVTLTVKVVGIVPAAEARDVLLDRVAACDAVLTQPAPKAQLTSLGDGERSFRLKFNPREGLSQREVVSRLLLILDSVKLDGVRFVT